MIAVKRLNGAEIFLNPHLIEMIEATPDTVITLTTGKRYVVLETVADVVAQILQYRQLISSGQLIDRDNGGDVEEEGF